MNPLVVVVDADVLGRQRTGDETYVRNLLRELGRPLADERELPAAAVTRATGSSCPAGSSRSSFPCARRSYGWRTRSPSSFDGSARRSPTRSTRYRFAHRARASSRSTTSRLRPGRRSWADAIAASFAGSYPGPFAVRRACSRSPSARSAISSRSTACRRHASWSPRTASIRRSHPGEGERDYVLVVGAIQARKNQLAAVDAANAVGLPVIVAGPEKDRSLADELRRRGARLEGYVEPERLAELYRGAACLVQPSRFEGFGLPVLEAMASGTPVVALPEPALEEVAGDAAVFVEEERLADGIRQALADRDRLVWAGLERARRFSWRATAEKTLAVYLEVLGR